MELKKETEIKVKEKVFMTSGKTNKEDRMNFVKCRKSLSSFFEHAQEPIRKGS